MDTSELLAVLKSGSFEPLVGTVEDGSVDFKREPYKLDSDAGKFELAKDVIAFANGYEDALIILGVATTKTDASPFDRASKVHPIPRGRVDEKQIANVIQDRAYPALRGVTVTTYAPTDDESRCLAAIRIPLQQDEDRPFLVLKPLGESGEKIQGWLVGVPSRATDDTQQIRDSELHGMISRGRNISGRLDELAVLVAHAVSERPAPSAPAPADPEPPTVIPSPFAGQVAKGHAEDALRQIAAESDEWGGETYAPALYLLASPANSVAVPTIFKRAGVREKLEHPPMTRKDGWNLSTSARAEIIAGTHLRLPDGARKLVELYEDGTLVAAARFDRLLVASGWGWSDVVQQPPLMKVNSLALVEFVHDFVLTYKELLAYMEPTPSTTTFGVGVRSARSSPVGRLYLPAHGLTSIAWQAPYERIPPDVDGYDQTVIAAAADIDPGRVALDLLGPLYAFFKHSDDAIPYLTEARDAVDPSAFSKTKAQ